MIDDEDSLDPRVRRTHRDVVRAAGDLLLERRPLRSRSVVSEVRPERRRIPERPQ